MSDFENILNEITESEEYLRYKEIGNILENDSYVMNLMNEIKELQHESLMLEYNDDPKYLELEDIIKEKVEVLNNNETYKIYLEKMKEYNNFIANTNNIFDNCVEAI